jgi:hypothetical protein
MSKTVVVRYQTRPEAADENARLIEEVYRSLAELGPDDFHYATYRLDDNVTFVHVAHLSGTQNPLMTLPAFAEFQREISTRCVEPPAARDATVVGSYRWTH